MCYTLTAIIYDKKGRVLSIGKNSYVKTHPLQAKYAKRIGRDEQVFLHAEVHAITRCRDLSKAYRILVVRYDQNGVQRLAKPCKLCELAIKECTPIKHVEFTR